MSTSPSTFIADRVVALASVTLTRRDDIQLIGFDAGDLDLMVRIRSESQEYEEYFGVILHGTQTLLATGEDADRYLHQQINKRRNRKHQLPYKQFSFPVIVLIFSMPNDAGFYAWSTEPIIDQMGTPRLRLNQTHSCSRFNRKALDEVVGRVKEWHERLFAVLEVR